MKHFQNRSISFYLTCAMTLTMWIVAVAYVITDLGDITFSWVAVMFLVIGGALGATSVFTKLDWLILPGSLCCSIALGELLRVGLPSISDIWNGVTFVGGNGWLVLGFIIATSVISLLACVLCFWPKATESK